jgi:cell division protein FtsL
MATLAAFFRRSDSGAVVRRQVAVGRFPQDPCRLRALPCEDVYLFCKKIDNSRVVRQADPAARRRSMRTVAISLTTAVVLMLLLVPHGLNVIAGYQISSLERERDVLEGERKRLQLAEARLLSPSRLHQLAAELQFVDPEPERIVYTNTAPEGALALNTPAKAK